MTSSISPTRTSASGSARRVAYPSSSGSGRASLGGPHLPAAQRGELVVELAGQARDPCQVPRLGGPAAVHRRSADRTLQLLDLAEDRVPGPVAGLVGADGVEVGRSGGPRGARRPGRRTARRSRGSPAADARGSTRSRSSPASTTAPPGGDGAAGGSVLPVRPARSSRASSVRARAVARRLGEDAADVRGALDAGELADDAGLSELALDGLALLVEDRPAAGHEEPQERRRGVAQVRGEADRAEHEEVQGAVGAARLVRHAVLRLGGRGPRVYGRARRSSRPATNPAASRRVSAAAASTHSPKRT